MVTTYAKLVKADGKAPEEVEKQVANALAELSNSAEIKGQLNELYFVGAQVCVLFIPWIPEIYFNKTSFIMRLVVIVIN